VLSLKLTELLYACAGSYLHPYSPRGLIPPTFVRHPALSPDKPPNISQGVLNVTFAVQTLGSYSRSLTLHSLCVIKHDRTVLLYGFF